MVRTGSGLAQESLQRYRCWRGQRHPIALTPPSLSRGYADLKPTSGKSEADLLVEELQELYDLPVHKRQVNEFTR